MVPTRVRGGSHPLLLDDSGRSQSTASTMACVCSRSACYQQVQKVEMREGWHMFRGLFV
jgi:hypothetical protein